MQYYKHQFSNIEDYLHHRRPYLMVDQIESISDTEIRTEKAFTGEEFFRQGHFPGAPIFPGAMMQEVTTQSAGVLIAARYNPMQDYDTHDPDFNPIALGVLVQVKDAKFKRFAKPGDILKARITLNEHTDTVFDFSGEIKVNQQLVMRNRFRLANVDSQLLQAAAV